MSASPELLAIDSRLRVEQRQHSLAANFLTVAHQMLVHEDRDRVCFALDKRLGSFDVEPFVKAAIAPQTFDDVWQGGRPLEMASRYLESIADRSVIDAVKVHATMLPDIGHVVVGSGVSANVV
ncbi:MAG: hypothetical protein M3485_01780, partial [Pseudomonadota bacterium]|nr:hypothetical protein [Pseudomonadota bacterium]